MPSSVVSVPIELLPLLLIGGLLYVPPAAGFSERQLPGSCRTGAMTCLMGELQDLYYSC